MKKIAAVITAILLFGTLLTGCNTQSKQAEQVSSKTKKKLVVGTSGGFYPFAMMDRNGRMIGYEIDLVHGLGEYLNMEVEIQPYNSLSNILAAIPAKKVDLIICDITITEKRKEMIDFSIPYLEGYLNVAVIDKYKDLSKWEDLDRPGIVIGIVMGSTAEVVTQKMSKATIKKFEGTSLAAQALLNKQIDAVIEDESWVKVFKAYNPSIAVLPVRVGEPEPLGIGVGKGNKELLDKVNAYLKHYKESGAADKNYEKWFLNDAWIELVPPKTY